MKLSDFNYDFPEELIATEPLRERDASRMMVLDKGCHSLKHSFVREFPKFLRKGDVVVVNDSKVFPARLVGRKESGGYFEVLLLCHPDPERSEWGRISSNQLSSGDSSPRAAGLRMTDKRWHCITNQTKTAKPGLKIVFRTKQSHELIGTVISREGDELLIEFDRPELIEKVGLPPVPPYIRAARQNVTAELALPNSGKASFAATSYDKARYQTVYARHTGSAAAPTAGLHFTNRLLKKIKEAGAKLASVTLHVGLDTFSPVRVKNIDDHKMHGEEFFVPEETVTAIEHAKVNGGRIVAIGTTTVRALESFACHCEPRRGAAIPRVNSGDCFATLAMTKRNTNLFIRPGHNFRMVDVMLTNFHQPESTLLMMVSAFAGRDFIMKAYKEAIERKYRLFSYGDCMLIL